MYVWDELTMNSKELPVFSGCDGENAGGEGHTGDFYLIRRLIS